MVFFLRKSTWFGFSDLRQQAQPQSHYPCQTISLSLHDLQLRKLEAQRKNLNQTGSIPTGFNSTMETDEEGKGAESSVGSKVFISNGDAIVEPYEGMEFDSEDAAKIFYDDYARQVGFVMRVMSCRRSEKDGRILARRIGCNKEGYCVSIRGKFGAVRKPRPSTREGCKAMIHVKYEKSGKWVITKFVKDHNHPLVVSPREARQTMDEKDKRIQELTVELRNKKRLCVTYQEQLIAFMKIVEEHSDQLSKKVQHVVNNLKNFDSIEQELMRR